MAYADQPLTLDDMLALAESLTTPPSPPTILCDCTHAFWRGTRVRSIASISSS